MQLKHRFRAFGATLVDLFTSRIDLAAAEFEDLLARVGTMLTLVLVCAFAAFSAMLFLGLAVAFAVPDEYRWLPSLAFAVFFAGGAGISAWQLRRFLRDQPPPFASTRDVLHRDAAAIRPTIQEAAVEATAESSVTTYSS